ncbi:MAG: hypothetical protein PVF17_10680 [Ignavibacteria bacterium]|jgi:hypothetical protein
MCIRIILLFSLLISISFFNCSSPPDIEIINAEFVENIYFSGMSLPPMIQGVQTQVSVGENGVYCKYVDHHIIKLELNFNFKAIATQEEVGSKEHKKELFNTLSKIAHLYDGEIEQDLFWGYWPTEVTETSVTDMSLIYVIPATTDMSKLKFEYDTSILGGTTGIYTYSKFADMKPLEKTEDEEG